MVYFFPVFLASLTPLARLLRDPILAERRARWGRRPPRRPPLACGGISAGAPGPSSAPRAALALIHSAVPFSAPASFPSRLPARARRPFPCPVLPPPVAFGSGRFPLPRLWSSPDPELPRPFLPAAAFPPAAGPRIHTPFSLGLHQASPGHAALLITCLELGAPIPPDSGVAWTADP